MKTRSHSTNWYTGTKTVTDDGGMPYELKKSQKGELNKINDALKRLGDWKSFSFNNSKRSKKK